MHIKAQLGHDVKKQMQTYTNKARITTYCAALYSKLYPDLLKYDKLKSELCCKLATNYFSTLAKTVRVSFCPSSNLRFPGCGIAGRQGNDGVVTESILSDTFVKYLNVMLLLYAVSRRLTSLALLVSDKEKKNRQNTSRRFQHWWRTVDIRDRNLTSGERKWNTVN